MKLSRYGYLIGEGFRNIFTHRFMSFASVTIIIACLIVMGSFTLLDINVNNIIDDIGNQNQILAYVDESMSAQDASAKLQTKIAAIDNVANVEFVSRTEAKENFMEKYDESLMEGIDDEVFRHRFVVQLTDLSQMAQTQAAISEVDGIVKVNAPIDYADKFISVRNVVSVVSLALIVILVFVSLFIMSNTIKLATFGRREEIAIMKMVGASNSFIRCPFVVEGLILGVVGGGLAFLAQWGLYTALESKITSSLAISFVNIVPFSELWPFVLAVFMAVGVIVGAFGGAIAIRNYLKV
ncbi:MAG: permease-like cell division protein FtsX [Oscillospiraceae bacterium]|nr:permease-like cell division protein FtsX [Oscillospiraceae bacterium]